MNELPMDAADRRKAEDALRESQIHLQFALSAAQLGDWELDLATNEIRRSPWHDRCFGYPNPLPHWNLGNFLAHIHPEDRPRVERHLQRAILEHARLDLECRVVWPDHTVHWIAFQANVYLLDGQPNRMHGIVRDITERKRIEAELQAAAETLTQIVRVQQEIVQANLPLTEMMLLMARRTQEVTRASGGVVELIDGTDMVYAACSGSAAPHKGFRIKQSGSFSGLALSTRSTLYCEDTESDPRVDLLSCRRIGVRSMIVAPLRVNDGIVGVLKILSDRPQAFTHRDFNNLRILVETLGVVIQNQRAAEALRASIDELRTLAEAVPQIVWATTPDGKNVYLNRQWMAYTGLALEESLGDGWIKPFHPDDRERAWQAWQQAISGAATYSLECRLRRADGQYRWWLVRGEPLRDEIGRTLKWFGTCTDIHDLKVAELEISRRNRALKMLSRANEALIHADDEEKLLKQVCQIAVEVGGYAMVWAGYAQEDEPRTIRPVAFAGDERGYLSKIQLSWSEAETVGQGPAGRTIRSGQLVVCPDLTAPGEKFFWKEEAILRNYKSAVCLPLSDKHRCFGLLAFHSAEVHTPAADELQLLQELADDLAFGINTIRVRLERRRVEAAIRQMALSVAATTDESFFEQLALNMAQAVGAQGAFIARMTPGETLATRTVAVVVDGQKRENFDFTLEQTPCEPLVRDGVCVVSNQADESLAACPALDQFSAQAYVARSLVDGSGQTLGLLFVLFRHSIRESEFIESTLQIFAVRAAAELARQRVDEQVRYQASLLDKATDAIIVRDLDHRVLFWNKGAERIYGWTREEALNRSSHPVLLPDPAALALAMRALLDKEEWTGELKKDTKRGRSITLDCRWSLIRTDQGEPKAVLAIETDITERKQLEAQFLRAQRMESLGTLAGGIAHDLNNVLAPILMSIDLLKSEISNTEALEILRTLQSAAQHGTELVRQVLSFARGVEGQRITVNLLHLVRDIRMMVRDTFPKNITFDVRHPADIWLVTGDPTQFHQALTNLCVNARDAMPEGGKLTLTLENVVLDDTYAAMNPETSPGAFVRITVADTGAGIPESIQEKIFEPFFTTKAFGKGTGLGLSTSLGIIRSHGGFIHLHSEIGKGTAFEVFVPASQTPGPAQAMPASDALPPRGNGELILVVDDEPSIQKVARSTLQRFGYRVLTASNGAEALSIYAREPESIAVVLTDIAMPIMDGVALIIALRTINPAVKVIASSGNSLKDGLAEVLGADIGHFVPKPYTAEVMLKAVREALFDG